MLKQRCLRCDAVLDDNGNCFFCNPPKPGDLKLRPFRSAKRTQNMVGNAAVVAALLLLSIVVTEAVGGSFLEIVSRPVRWLTNFSLDGPGASKNPLREGTDR